jgi:hypothetical protein
VTPLYPQKLVLTSPKSDGRLVSIVSSQTKTMKLLLLLLLLYIPYSYIFALTKLNLPSLCTQRHHLDTLFFIHACRGLKSCPSLLEMVYRRAPPHHVRDFSAFSVRPSNKNCPSARCANAAKVVGKFLDLFTVRAVSLHSMQQLVLN